MRLQFVTIGQNLNWPRGRLSLARKKNTKRIYDSRFSSSNNKGVKPKFNYCVFFDRQKYRDCRCQESFIKRFRGHDFWPCLSQTVMFGKSIVASTFMFLFKACQYEVVYSVFKVRLHFDY